MAAKQNKLPKVGPPTDDGHPVAFDQSQKRFASLLKRRLVHAFRFGLSARINIMNESTIERGQTDDVAFFDEISDGGAGSRRQWPG